MKDSAEWFVGGVSFGLFVFMVQTPLLTQLYQTNYPNRTRGLLFSIVAIARGLVAVGFGLFAGSLLEGDIGNYRPLLWIFAASGLGAALCLFGIPSGPVPRQRVPFFRAFRWVGEDRLFRNLLIAWMLVGLANLTGYKLFVEYLQNPRSGHGFSPKEIAFLTISLLFGTKLATTLFWGFLFDRMNFYLLRGVLNTVFASAILLFYLGTEMWVIALGMCVQGLAFAGGNIAWSLWVTKVAPPERVGEYMSVHTFLTGLRGLFAPFIGYWLLNDVGISPALLGIGCAGLMMLSNATLWSEVRFGKARRKGVPLAPRDLGA
jgi:MFS family permease